MEKRDKRYRNDPVKINMNQGTDPETGDQTQGMMIEFVLKE